MTFLSDSQSSPLNFGPDKSQIVRGLAIIFMIILHNHTLSEFKICVPIFTFLVGYGYAFAKRKDVIHGLKRSWHLLSHFWLILLGLFLPVAIWTGGYKPTISDIATEMFGLTSHLNWYSWYIYFYIYAMAVMIPISKIIDRFGIIGTLGSIVIAMGGCAAMHLIPNWSDNIWLQALQDSLLCSPVMLSGYYLASHNTAAKIKIRHNPLTAIVLLIVSVGIFFLRGLPYSSFLDFITVPIFVLAIVGVFNILTAQWLANLFISLGKESMNMWFFHAIFATTVTAGAFAPLIDWVQLKILHILTVIIVSYFVSRLFTSIYNQLSKSTEKRDKKPVSTNA